MNKFTNNVYLLYLCFLFDTHIAMRLFFQSSGLLLLLVLCCSMQPSRKNSAYVKYIETYGTLAVQQMKEFRIPASITLAQGILESGAGQGALAKKSNNHFGIKCHNDWKGGRAYHTDDLEGECFRKYRHVEDSYRDHSKFLAERSRYSVLFELNIKDYKAWCKGLQKCGYATDKAYANKLIKLIEDYELYLYDSAKTKKVKTTKEKPAKETVRRRNIYKEFGLIYIEALSGDSFDDIAIYTGFSTKELLKFNELPEGYPLQKGDRVYLEKKKNKADKPNYDHVVQIGESIHSIAQKYGIRLKSLYHINKLNKDYIPEEGDVLKLR